MTIARYSITTGLHGCYMPDSGPYSFTCTRRRELADCIREEIANQGWPKALIREVKLTRLWDHIKRHGSSAAHFVVIHKGYEIAFHGLTEAEAEALIEEELG